MLVCKNEQDVPLRTDMYFNWSTKWSIKLATWANKGNDKNLPIHKTNEKSTNYPKSRWESGRKHPIKIAPHLSGLLGPDQLIHTLVKNHLWPLQDAFEESEAGKLLNWHVMSENRQIADFDFAYLWNECKVATTMTSSLSAVCYLAIAIIEQFEFYEVSLL